MQQAATELNAEVQGVALAAYAVSVSVVKTLAAKSLLDKGEVGRMLTGILLVLERNEMVPEPAAHSARSLPSSLAAEFEVPFKRPN